MNELFAYNTPAYFWQPLPPVPDEIWQQAVEQTLFLLPDGITKQEKLTVEQVTSRVLGEELFGPDRYQLSRLKSIYYAYARPILPGWSRHLIRKVRQPAVEKQNKVIHWPVEERFAAFQFGVLENVLAITQQSEIEFVSLWPQGKRFAFVITHDVEGPSGRDFVPELMALEEQYGFRSSFNFVPEGYPVNDNLLTEIRERGFEVGVHGLKHDGKLFSSHSEFEKRAKKINQYLTKWSAVGYRSPMTHRHPEWMQALEIDYDLSFFDTDPYEPMAGGTMSIWPFFMGKFLELPYTLMQDHTYLKVFANRTPQEWLNKVDFIRRYYGMALLNAHPDYLTSADNLKVYESLLAQMATYSDVWSALPCLVSQWWRNRLAYYLENDTNSKGDKIEYMPERWCASIDNNGQLSIRLPDRMKDLA